MSLVAYTLDEQRRPAPVKPEALKLLQCLQFCHFLTSCLPSEHCILVHSASSQQVELLYALVWCAGPWSLPSGLLSFSFARLFLTSIIDAEVLSCCGPCFRRLCLPILLPSHRLRRCGGWPRLLAFLSLLLSILKLCGNYVDLVLLSIYYYTILAQVMMAELPWAKSWFASSLSLCKSVLLPVLMVI